MKILIFGLPGSGKTHLAERLQKHLNCAWYNADIMRKMAHDWDFSEQGRIRQARRMEVIAHYENNYGRTVICDFVCPTQVMRNIFSADYSIWMNTIEFGVYEDTNKIFEKPDNADLIINRFLTDEEIADVVNQITGVHQ